MLNLYSTNHIELTTLVVIALCYAINQSTVEGRVARMSDFVDKHAHCITVEGHHHHHHPSLAEKQQEGEEEFEVERKRNSYKHNRNSSRSGYGIGCNPDTDGYPCSFADKCGNFDISARQKYIVGGKDALPGDVPSHVLLEYPTTFGGGVLISDRHVATAAHMMRGKTLASYKIHAGSVVAPSIYDEDRQTRKIAQVCFPKSGPVNDFAIIKLDEPVNIGSFVKPACWPYEGRGEIDTESNDSQCFMSGFGISGWEVSDNGVPRAIYPLTMQKFRVKVVFCPSENDLEGTERHLCLESIPEYTAVGCPGDSGSAIVCKDRIGRITVVGVFTHNYDFGRYRNQKKNLCRPKDHRSVAMRLYPDESFNRDVLVDCSGDGRDELQV